jgi:NDP-sugar pyrophosphorylase family protein
MNALLICPSVRPAVSQLSEPAPLAIISLLGQSLVEYWLTHLALAGVTHVRILSDDRPEQIAALVENGARWGLEVTVTIEPRELTAAQAQFKYARELSVDAGPCEVAVADHFPGMPHLPLFTSYSDLFAALIEWMPRAKTIDRVGIREVSPGVWLGRNARVSPEARLHAPCWIGQSAYVGPGAVVGPMTLIEDRAFVESEAEVVATMIGPDTFVGKFAMIQNSLAWGNTLVNWKSGVSALVADAFLLCALRRPACARQSENIFGRISEIYSRNKDDLQMFWKHFLMNKEG